MVWSEIGLKNVLYLHKEYSRQNVVLCLKACMTQREEFYAYNLEMYKDAVTMSGISQKILASFAYSPVL